MPPGSENGDVRYRIDQGTGFLLIGFAFFTDMLDWVIAWIPFANIVWAFAAQLALAIIFYSLGVNPFYARPIPGEHKTKKGHKSKKPKKPKKPKKSGFWSLVRRFSGGRFGRFLFTLALEASPISLFSLIPWRTINTFLTIEESREEDEEEAEEKREKREEQEEGLEDVAEQRVRHERTEEYLGQIDQFDPGELAAMQDALAQNQSLRDGERGEYEREQYGSKSTEELERERGVAPPGQMFADRTRPLGAGEPYGGAKRPSELRRELEAPTGVSDADRRLVGALNAVDQTQRAGSLRDALKSGGEIGAIPRARPQSMQQGFDRAFQSQSQAATAQRAAREDRFTGGVSPVEGRRVEEAARSATHTPYQPSRQGPALAQARGALRQKQLSRDDYTRIVEASSRIPPIAKNAFLEDLKKHEWTGAKSLEEYQGIINTAPGAPAGAKSALFQEMNTAREASQLANSYQDTNALRNDVRVAVRDIIERRERSGNQKVPIGVNTAADAVFKKIRTEPRNWEPVEDALVDELLKETVARLKDRGLGGEVKVTLRGGGQ